MHIRRTCKWEFTSTSGRQSNTTNYINKLFTPYLKSTLPKLDQVCFFSDIFLSSIDKIEEDFLGVGLMLSSNKALCFLAKFSCSELNLIFLSPQSYDRFLPTI